MKTDYCLIFAIQDPECGGYKTEVPNFFKIIRYCLSASTCARWNPCLSDSLKGFHKFIALRGGGGENRKNSGLTHNFLYFPHCSFFFCSFNLCHSLLQIQLLPMCLSFDLLKCLHIKIKEIFFLSFCPFLFFNLLFSWVQNSRKRVRSWGGQALGMAPEFIQNSFLQFPKRVIWPFHNLLFYPSLPFPK